MWANLFFRSPRLTLLALGLVIVGGLTAYSSIGRQEDPLLRERFGNVVTFFPGAGPARVESLVTEKIEQELRKLKEINEIASLSRKGVSTLAVELVEGLPDTDLAWSKVRDGLADAQAFLPPDAGEPELTVSTTAAQTLLVALRWSNERDAELGLLTRLAEELENRLRNITGTKETEIYGEAEEEIRVTVDPDEVAAADLTVRQISSAIAQSDTKSPAGQARGARSDLTIEIGDDLTSVERVRRVPLKDTGTGEVLRVGDIALVSKDVKDPPRTIAIIDGTRAVAVGVTAEPDQRVDLWAQKARAVIASFEAELPQQIIVETVFDQSRYTEERLANLAINLALGALIVVLILIVTMGVRSAFLVGSALPMTLALVLAELNALGVDLHQMSVTGLIVSLGLLIDNAIVVTDEYNQFRAKGHDVAAAVGKAVRRLIVPLFASTATTVLAFAPIAFAPGGVGQFVGTIGVSVMLCVMSSYFLAMTVIPAIAGFSDQVFGRAIGDGSVWWRDGVNSPRLIAGFSGLLDVVIKRPWAGVGLATILPVAGFALGTTLVLQFFPPVDRNQFQVQLRLPEQVSIAETLETVERARKIFEKYPDIVSNHWFIGEGAPRVFYNAFSQQDGVSSYAGAFVTTKSAATTNRILPGLQADFRNAFPEALFLLLPFEQGPPFDAPIEIRVVGPELAELRRIGDDIRRVIAETDKVTYTIATLAGGTPKLVFVPDEFEAQSTGYDLADLARELNANLEGQSGGSILEGTEEIPVVVRVADANRESLMRLASQSLRAQSGAGNVPGNRLATIPLNALAEPVLVAEINGIARRNGERENRVQAYLVPYTLPAPILSQVQARLNEAGLSLPSGYRLNIGGEAEERDESLGNLAAFALPLFITMAGIIILSFNSFAYAGVVGLTGFLSIGLALFGVWIFGYPMGFTAIIGTLGLVGLAINGTIIVLSGLLEDPLARKKDPIAVREVTLSSTRHIVSTTLTTIGGLIPLIFFGGTFWPPFATAIAGGVAGAALISLIMTPSLFMLLSAPADEGADETVAFAKAAQSFSWFGRRRQKSI